MASAEVPAVCVCIGAGLQGGLPREFAAPSWGNPWGGVTGVMRLAFVE